MKTSPQGVAAITQFEGVMTVAYQDSVGVWTIGVGHTAAAGPPKPVKGMTITRGQAMDILSRDLGQYEAAVAKRLPNVPQNVFDGAVSFCFNLGQGNFAKASWIRLYLAGKYAAAETSFKSWNKAGGKVLAGLTTRRAHEADMIFRGRYPNGVTAPAMPMPKPQPDDPGPIPKPADKTPAAVKNTLATGGAVIAGGAVAAAHSVGIPWGWIAGGLTLAAIAVGLLVYMRKKG